MKCKRCGLVFADDVAARNHNPCITCAYCYIPFQRDDDVVTVGCLQRYHAACYAVRHIPLMPVYQEMS